MNKLFLSIIVIAAIAACNNSKPNTTTATERKAGTFRDKIGLQLYSLRNQTAEDLDKALQYVKEQGITDVELAGFANLTPPQYKAKLEQYGLKASSIGASFKDLRDSIDKVIQLAQLFGCQYVMNAWIDHKSDTITLEEIQNAVTVFNTAGKKLKEKGIQFCYHIHGYEFVPYQGGTYFDYLYQNTDPENVKFEEDVFWAKHGGQDPVEFLKKYGTRTPLMHIKDMDKSVKGNLTGHEKVEMDVVWGTGQIDIKAVCLLGAQMGVKHFYLEDESPNVLKQIPLSLAFAESF